MASPSAKVTASLADNEGLIPSAKVERALLQEVGVGMHPLLRMEG